MPYPKKYTKEELRLINTRKAQKNQLVYRCANCNRPFSTRQELVKHQESENG